MLQRIFLAIFILSIVFYPDSVFAQEATDTPSLNTTRQTILKERKDGLQVMRAQYLEQRNDFKLKLQTIRDTKKRALVERIDTKTSTFNKKMTDKMTSALTKMSNLLIKIQEDADTISSNGQNIQNLNTLIAVAQNTITTAQETVSAQAAKEYVATIDSEDSLRVDIGQTVSQFRNDIKDTYKTVINAKQDLVNAAQELRSLKNTSDVNANDLTN